MQYSAGRQSTLVINKGTGICVSWCGTNNADENVVLCPLVDLRLSIFSGSITCYRTEDGDEMIRSACIIAIGDEVLSGETINTNGAAVAQLLMSVGVKPEIQYVVPDRLESIQEALLQSLRRTDLVVLIGGLGPTHDDCTIDATAEALKKPIRLDEGLRERLSRRHSQSSGREESIRRQSRIIDGAVVWTNSRGQAPGQLLELKEQYLVLLPGPPRELEGLVDEYFRPWLQSLVTEGIQRDTYTVFDLGESAVAHELRALLTGAHPRTGIYASPGRVDVRVETGTSPADLVQRQRVRAWIRHRLLGHVYELGDGSREEFLIEWLHRDKLTIAAMESLTGGLVMASLIAVSGASSAVLGGVVAYTDEVKSRYGVSREVLQAHGAVSEECALAMAEAARRHFGSAVAVATTGYAGPTGGDHESPVGTFYVAATSEEDQVVTKRYVPLDRQSVRQVAVQTAISAVWELLKLPTIIKKTQDP